MKRLFARRWSVLATALLATMSSPSLANSSFATTYVNAVTMHDSGVYVLIEIRSPAGASEGCQGTTLVLPMDTTNASNSSYANNKLFKEMSVAAMTALTTDQPVQGWVNGCISIYNSAGSPGCPS